MRDTVNSVKHTGFENLVAKISEEVCLFSKEDYI